MIPSRDLAHAAVQFEAALSGAAWLVHCLDEAGSAGLPYQHVSWLLLLPDRYEGDHAELDSSSSVLLLSILFEGSVGAGKDVLWWNPLKVEKADPVALCQDHQVTDGRNTGWQPVR